MNKDSSASGSPELSWPDRLKQMLSREPADNEQLLELLRAAHQKGLYDADALAMIEGVLQVDDMQVRDIMIPRSQMVILERDANPDELLRTVVECGHSRFPVIGEHRDEVVGVLLAKDLLLYAYERKTARFNVREILRPAVFIPESKRLNVLLKEFRSSRNHLAIVVDEYGGVAGMVTIEDVLEQIVGEIEDEHDVDDDSGVKQMEPHSFHVKANLPIEDFNECFATQMSDEEFDTIGGIVLQAFGHLPERGESVEIDGLQFEVLNADSRRLRLLRVDTPR